MKEHIVDRTDCCDELRLEIEVLEEGVAPSLFLGLFAGASVAASAGVAVSSPCW